jgi:prephenate dehydrogenase
LIETYERHLREMKRLIKAKDAAGIEKQLDKARQEREQLNAKGPSKD